MKGRFQKKYSILIISSVTLLFGTLAFLYLTNPILFWNKFSSGRAGFFFKHPSNWPVSQCSKSEVYQFEGRIEQIDFADDCCPNARNDSFGYIIVERINPATTHDIYLKENYSNWDYKMTQIGKKTAYILTPKPKDLKEAGAFTTTTNIYLIIKPPLIYTIGVTNPNYGFKNDKNENLFTFEKILSTFEITN
ncbi:hypothetical protein KJ570_01865 [Patescibacteria group bacterium]|nr:hypothetical protein [Patescibacteria group bacterium]MBU2035849.1 hypothetical protein [Patescibacteria group bacterium]